jgi:hypothetical protein
VEEGAHVGCMISWRKGQCSAASQCAVCAVVCSSRRPARAGTAPTKHRKHIGSRLCCCTSCQLLGDAMESPSRGQHCGWVLRLRTDCSRGVEAGGTNGRPQRASGAAETRMGILLRTLFGANRSEPGAMEGGEAVDSYGWAMGAVGSGLQGHVINTGTHPTQADVQLIASAAAASGVPQLVPLLQCTCL